MQNQSFFFLRKGVKIDTMMGVERKDYATSGGVAGGVGTYRSQSPYNPLHLETILLRTKYSLSVRH